MSNSQVQLPQEIWTKILKYVPSTDLAAPLTVCHAWNILVKRRYYENIKFFRLSSIDRFIAYVKISLDHPNLRVKKITFTDFHLHTRHLSTFERRFHELMALCLQVQTLSADSEHLGSYVVKSLHSYPTRLKSLSSFPYASSHEYDACAYKYRNTLEDYVMNNCDYWSLNHFFKRIMIFRQLEKLSIRNASVITLKHLEYILSVCPHLEDLSMTQYYRPVIFEGSIDENDSDEYISDEYDNEGVISGFDSKKFSKMQQYPKVKRLSIKTTADDLLHLIPFLLKLNHLERLEIESTAIDRSIFQVQNHGLKENFKPFLNYISTLPYVSFIGKSIRFNQDPALAVSCLGFFLQSCTSWEHTSLKIRHYPVIELLYYNEFDYTVTNSKHRELTIALPEFQVNNSSIHTKYINTFAPFVNTLEVYYSFATKGKNACESFLYAALSQCAVLRSLTIFCGKVENTFPRIARNITMKR
jgi:hypothetical protein